MITEKDYPVYGRWNVTTEGDCECKTVKHLGYWDGFVDEIALYLADKAYYSLKFELVDDQPSKFIPKSSEVDVKFPIDSGTWAMDKKTIVNKMAKLFKDRPVIIDRSNNFASFKIKLKDEKSKKEIDKVKAIKKLTSNFSKKELDLLGLSKMV